MGTNILNEGDSDYDTYKEEMDVPEGDFSLARLYIDVSRWYTYYIQL